MYYGISVDARGIIFNLRFHPHILEHSPTGGLGVTEGPTQLQQKADDHFRSYQQVTDLLEEKKVLMTIIRQLCIEAGKEIEVG